VPVGKKMKRRREEFIARYIEVLVHKAIPELRAKLPEEGFVSEMQPQADRIIHELTKEA
jgi:hypothetical protein